MDSTLDNWTFPTVFGRSPLRTVIDTLDTYISNKSQSEDTSKSDKSILEKPFNSSKIWFYYQNRDSSSTTVSRSSSQCSCFSCNEVGPIERRISHINEGKRVNDFYHFGEVLGEGTFSVVYLAESKLEPGGLAAVKVISRSSLKKNNEDLISLVDKEVNILASLDHPHIVHLNEVYYDKNSICLIMELAKGGEVFDRLVEEGNFSEKVASTLVVQLLHAVEYLHEQGVVHRDLKLENILYYNDDEESKIMVADFGLSEYAWDISDETPICGTPGYMAPEVLSEKLVTPASDVWSIGVITYMLLAGYPPFFPNNDVENEDEEALIQQIIRGDFEFHSHTWQHISPSAKDFIRRLMSVDYQTRVTCTEALQHPWLSGSQVRRQTGLHEMLPDASTVLCAGGIAIFVHFYLWIISYFFGVDFWIYSNN